MFFSFYRGAHNDPVEEAVCSKHRGDSRGENTFDCSGHRGLKRAGMVGLLQPGEPPALPGWQ